MPCWSAWWYPAAPLLNHQYPAAPQLTPPSSERKVSMPPAQTRFGSAGSTAITLSYQPWLKNEAPETHSENANSGFDSSTRLIRCWSVVTAALASTCVVKLPRSPFDVERYTACRPSVPGPPEVVLADIT